MEIVLPAIKYGAPWVLVVMGSIVIFWRPKRSQRLASNLWIVAFIFVGGAVSWFQYLDEQRSAQAFEKLETAITGGDHFAYLSVRSAIAPNGENYLATSTSGPIPRSNFSIRALSDDGQVIFRREHSLRPLPKTTAHFPISLPAGQYKIDFIMGEKTWTEFLEFQRTGDGVDQVYWILKDDEIVKRYP